MSGMLRNHFFGPVAAVRPVLFLRLLYLLLAVDIWLHFVPRSAIYGLDAFNVVHFGWLSAVTPMPSADLYASIMVVVGFASLAVALIGYHRQLMVLTFVLFTYAWTMSQLDSYQHHYFLSLMLLLSIFLPRTTPAEAVGSAVMQGDAPAATVRGAPAVSAWAFVLAGIQVAILYFYAAISKLDARWVEGSVMGNLSTPGEGASTDAVPVLGAMLGDKVWPVLAVGAIASEFVLALGFVLAARRDRVVSAGRGKVLSAAMWGCWLLAMGLHAGIEWFHLRIGLFSYYMMALACVFFLPAAVLLPVARGFAWVSRGVGGATSRGVARSGAWGAWVAGAVALAVVIPVMLAALDVPGVLAGAVVAGVLLLALFAHAALSGERARAGAFVLAAAAFILLSGGILVASNVRANMFQTLAQMSHRANRLEQAIAYYEKGGRYRVWSGSLTQEQYQARMSANIGDALHGLGRLEEAEARFKEAIKLDAKNVGARVNLASLYTDLGRGADAAEMLIQVIELQPTNAGARFNLGVLLMSGGRTEKAISQFEAAVESDPSMIEAQHNLAMAYLSLKNEKAALTPLRQILAYTPDSVDALTNLSSILAKSTDPTVRNVDEAVRHAEHAAKVTGRKSVDVLRTLAGAYSASGRHADAEAALNEAAQLRERKSTAGAQ